VANRSLKNEAIIDIQVMVAKLFIPGVKGKVTRDLKPNSLLNLPVSSKKDMTTEGLIPIT
jgi:hypothetical protein